MGAFLDKPKTEKQNERGEGVNIRYALATMQGWRVDMEDTHSAVTGLPLPNMNEWSFFAVYDGHGGARVAKHSADNLLAAVLKTDELKRVSELLGSTAANSSKQQPADATKPKPASPLPEASESEEVTKTKDGMRRGFLEFDAAMREVPEVYGENERSGCTVTSVLISPRHLYFANLGDSRSVLSRNASAFFSTDDHKPFNAPERDRIIKAGGSVMIQRVNGSLAVSRALGDYEYKSVPGVSQCNQLVSPEPDVIAIQRSPQDEFIILACDGIFDVMTNHELSDFVRSRLYVTDDLTDIANNVLDTALSKGSRDNMSVVILTFPGAPVVQQSAVEQDQKLRVLLQERVESIASLCDSSSDLDFDYVLRVLSTQGELPGLPPGAGMHAMRGFIDDCITRLTEGGESEEEGQGASAEPVSKA